MKEYLQFIPRATVFDNLAAFSANWLKDDSNCRSNLTGTRMPDLVDYRTLAGSGPKNAHTSGFWNEGNVLSPFFEKRAICCYCGFVIMEG